MRQILFCLMIVLQFTLSYSQTQLNKFTIKSFEGRKVTLTIKDTIRGRVLEVCCSTDTLFLSDYIGNIESVRLLSDRFLQVIYDVRGGTGVQYRNTVVLSLNKGKINPSLLITSYAYSISPSRKNTSTLDGESLFNISLNVSGQKKSDYKVLAVIRNQQTSSSNPKENYNNHEQSILSFDTTHHIFYNTEVILPKQIMVCNPKNFNTSAFPLLVNEKVPAIKMGKEDVYYYIKGVWYHKGFQDVFYQDYYR